MRDPVPAPASSLPTFTLVSPPRSVPAGIRRKLLFGGVINQMGWFFFGVGLVFFGIFVMNSDIWSYVVFSGKIGHATGLVVALHETGSSENKRRIYAAEYAYSVAGTEYRGTSYSTRPPGGAGAVVEVEYRESDPDISRIRGMRRYRFSILASACIVFPLAGLYIVVRGLRRGLRDIHVLNRGRAAMGVLVAKEPSGVEVNDQPVYNLTFRFRTDEGAEHRGVVSALHTIPLEDEPVERLLYDPRHPEHIVVVDNLPGAATIDERGELTGGGSGALVLVLPALVTTSLLALLYFG